jgi:hypothetical protein
LAYCLPESMIANGVRAYHSVADDLRASETGEGIDE